MGRHLIQELLKDEGVLPIVLVRSRESWEKNDWARKLKGVELIEGSVTDGSVAEPGAWAADPRLENLAGICHLAAVVRHTRTDTAEMIQTNVEGTLNMVRLAGRYKARMIFISTSGTVGCFGNPNEWADERAPYCGKEAGIWPYYDSKIQAEKKGRDLASRLGVELVIFRPPVFLGPGDHRFRATGPILRMLRGKLPFILRGGIHFVDIRDAVSAMIRAMSIPKPQPVYHLCGTNVSIDEFFEMVGKVSGVQPPRLHLPIGMIRLLATVTQKIDVLLGREGHPTLPDPVVFEMASKYWGLKSLYARDDLGSDVVPGRGVPEEGRHVDHGYGLHGRTCGLHD